MDPEHMFRSQKTSKLEQTDFLNIYIRQNMSNFVQDISKKINCDILFESEKNYAHSDCLHCMDHNKKAIKKLLSLSKNNHFTDLYPANYFEENLNPKKSRLSENNENKLFMIMLYFYPNWQTPASHFLSLPRKKLEDFVNESLRTIKSLSIIKDFVRADFVFLRKGTHF